MRRIGRRYLPGVCFIMSLVAGIAEAQSVTDFIIIDQFGYRPNAEKIAVIKDPQVGFDADESFDPGETFAVVSTPDSINVFEGGITEWNNGTTHAASGDKCWWFDFSTVTTPGSYYVLDVENNVKSFDFEIADDVYSEVLRQTMRTFFYQRVGFAKEEPHAGAPWADGASHLGTLQDTQARKFDEPDNSDTERDLSGGWYDAGDYNKYTPWTSNYIIELLQAYEETPDVWGDNYCLPYSGNGTPDILDEVQWGLEHLLKLQEDDGSLLSVVSLDHAYPPSAATGPTLYGDVNTTSALTGATAYAYGAKVFGAMGMDAFSEELTLAAENAWNWAESNPEVEWRNNDAADNSVGIGAGQQETDDYGRLAYKVRAAIYLFELTGDTEYRDSVDANYEGIHLLEWNYAYPFEEANQGALLHYASLNNATAAVAADINDTYHAAMQSDRNFQALTSDPDPYLSFLNDYVWGSNAIKARKGLMFTSFVNYEINTAQDDDALRFAERFVHYIHGLNPLNFCYLSNMSGFGAEQGVKEFYHTWYADGSDWDITGTSTYGPAPGFLVGGANPSYDWDGCCNTGSCADRCDAAVHAEITEQPTQKAYKDFNTSWPMNSWQLSENSLGYQIAYARLLAKFVDQTSVEAMVCEKSTVNPPVLIIEEEETPLNAPDDTTGRILYPNPTKGLLKTESISPFTIQLFDIQGKLVLEGIISKDRPFNSSKLGTGIYTVRYLSESGVNVEQKIVIEQ